MLVLTLIGVAMLVALVVRWKRMRLPLSLLLLLLLAMLLQRIHCNHDEGEHRKPGPIEPICTDPTGTAAGCDHPGMTVDAGQP